MTLPAWLGLPELAAGAAALALNAYVLMGGADFGGGVWDLLARGPRRDGQRALISRAIGPIWEANHVWLIIVIVLLFTAFPPAFAVLGTVLHVPLTLMLVGIVLRGSAFVFRSYGSGDERAERRWGRAFAIASTATPVLLGICVGAIASGDVGAASARLAEMAAGAPAPSFHEAYVAPWLAPFPMAVGFLALVLFAFLAAVYLTLEADGDALREDFRRHALSAAALAFVAAFGALALSPGEAPRLREGLLAAPWAPPLQLAIAVAAVAAIVALWRRHFRLARFAAAAQVSLILWGWLVAQFPYLIPTTLTIRSAAAPRITLHLMLAGLAAGSAILIPSLLYLFRTFGGARAGRSA